MLSGKEGDNEGIMGVPAAQWPSKGVLGRQAREGFPGRRASGPEWGERVARQQPGELTGPVVGKADVNKADEAS